MTGAMLVESRDRVSAGADRQRAATVQMQRAWRGILGRRVFSDLFFEAVEAEIGHETLESFCSPSCDEAEAAPCSRQRSSTPSLEEAHEEASYKYDHHISAAAEPSSRRARQQSMPSSPVGSNGAHKGVPRWASSAAMLESPSAAPTMRWASSAALQELSPAVCAASAASGSLSSSGVCHRRSASRGGGYGAGSMGANGVGGPSAHRRTASESLHRRTASAGQRPSALSHSFRGEGAAQGDADAPTKAVGQDGGSSSGGGSGGSGGGKSGGGSWSTAEAYLEDDGTPGLEFTEEMAESMSIEALKVSA